MFLVRLILWILGNTVALWLATVATPTLTLNGTLQEWLLAGLVLGIANLVLKPILKTLAGPLIILTFGLGLLVVQGIVLWATRIGLDVFTTAVLTIQFPWGYVWGAVVISIANVLFTGLRRTLTAPAPDDVPLEEWNEAELREELEHLHAELNEVKTQHDEQDDDTWENEAWEEDEEWEEEEYEDEYEDDEWDDA